MWQAIGVVVSPLKYLMFRFLAQFHRTVRPRVAIICNHELLVIRNWGDRTWSLPGGGAHHNEMPEQAAVRECRDEVGISLLTSQLTPLATLTMPWYDAPIFVWYSDTKPSIVLQKLEITGAQWVRRQNLPPLEDALADLVMKLDF